MNPTDQVSRLDHHLMIHEQRLRRARLVVFSVAGLFVAGAVGTCVASSFDEPLQTGSVHRSSVNSGGEAALAPKSFPLREDDKLEALNQQLIAQRLEISQLTDRLSALSSRMEALEVSVNVSSPRSSAMASIAPVNQPASVLPAAKTALPAKPTRKRASEAKSAGPISVGGAPLTAISKASPQ